MAKDLKNIIQDRVNINGSSSLIYKPLIFNLKRKNDRTNLLSLFRQNKILKVIDDFDEEKKELNIVKNPKIISHALLFPQKRKIKNKIVLEDGVWVYYPWRETLVHILDKKSYHQLRISRNFNLILPTEQKKFENLRIGLAGLNVGNPAAICFALEGIWKMKFADFDPLSLSNLNRFRAGIPDLGLNKVFLSARQAYEINPFLGIEIFEKGIQPENIDRFLLKPKIDVLIEEMDNLKLKIVIREKAKKYRIPVLMVTGNGENIIIDIERFDQNPRLSLLNGYLKKGVIDKIQKIQPGKGTFEERIELARDFMGAKYLTKRLQDSFRLVGSKLAGIPQIAESSFLRGAALCYFVRQIATGKKVPSGRYYLKLDSVIKNK
ncbi:MAG: ThiF family adenylyltransferase [Parcubacteria group bacterium]|nr:ThiF family adenylyltransferase [Parcubacteria group bacterium]